MNCKLFPIFQCNRNNFVFNINQNESHDSEFDLFIKKKWQEALDDNNFRYKLDIQKWKILNGEYNYLAQVIRNYINLLYNLILNKKKIVLSLLIILIYN